MSFMIEDSVKLHYAGLYLLLVMTEESRDFPLVLPKEEKVLEPILEFLFQRKYVKIKDDICYTISPIGQDTADLFQSRFEDFLRQYDVYCAVDIDEGEFALAAYHDFPDAEQWQEYLDQDRWVDLRIAVAEERGLDPVEVVFMSFVAEGRFGRDENGWDDDLILGSVWSEIQTICTTAIKLNDLGYIDNGEMISSQDVMADILAQGEKVRKEINKKCE